MQPHRILAGAAALLSALSVGWNNGVQAQNCPPNNVQTTQTFTDEYGPTTPPWNGLILSLPKFQPAAGQTLLKAEITAEAFAEGTVQAENTSTTGGHLFVWNLGSAIQLDIPVPGQPPLAFAPSIGGQDPLGTFDGTVDFGGTSGVSHPNLAASDSDGATFTDPTVLQNVFTGAGNVDYTHSAADASSHTGGGNLALVFINHARLRVTVKYTICTPVQPNDCNLRHRRNCGSLLLYPEFDNHIGSQTLVTITNACCDDDSDGTWVEFRFINQLNCQESNFSRKLSPCDTFTFIAGAMNPNVTAGYLYAYAKRGPSGSSNNPSGDPWVFNRLIGQEMVINGATLLDYSMNAVSFLGLGNDHELNDDDDDGIRDLNGPNSGTPEYEEAPDEIMLPRFLGQDPNVAGFSSQLILIGLSGGMTFTTMIDVLGYNDNEDPQSSQYSFYCWAKPYLREVAPFTLETYLDSLPSNAPNEIAGHASHESGWLRINGLVANSSGPETIFDPAVYAVLIERFGSYMAADLPYEYCTQVNGDLLPVNVLGDGPAPVAGDNQ